MSYINQIIARWRPHDVHSLHWFVEQGIGPRFVQSWAWDYYKQGVFDKLGPGVYKRSADDKAHWAGLVRLLQEEKGLQIHICGRTALELAGAVHSVPLRPEPLLFLTSYSGHKLPIWFQAVDAGCQFRFKPSTLFTKQFFHTYKNKLLVRREELYKLQFLTSCRELAVLEFLNQIDLRYAFEDAENYVESQFNMRPQIVQLLLENCQSIKIKRTFLYLSEKFNHGYLKKMHLNAIELGRGRRQVACGWTKFDKKYQITVRKEDADNP